MAVLLDEEVEELLADLVRGQHKGESPQRHNGHPENKWNYMQFCGSASSLFDFFVFLVVNRSAARNRVAFAESLSPTPGLLLGKK